MVSLTSVDQLNILYDMSRYQDTITKLCLDRQKYPTAVKIVAN